MDLIACATMLRRHTILLAVLSSYPEPPDAKLTPLLSWASLRFGSKKPGIILDMPSFSAA